MCDLDNLTDKVHLFAYPARLSLLEPGGEILVLPALIKNMDHEGAAVQFAKGYHLRLPARLAAGRLRLSFESPGGEAVELEGRLGAVLSRQDGQMLAQVDFQDLPPTEAEAIERLLSASRKDHVALWHHWDEWQQQWGPRK
jgi:hypothetical protein